MLRKYLLIVALGILSSCPALAQIDTEFWFAPPAITRGHGSLPVYIRFASQDNPTTITIFQPARGEILTTFSIPAQTAHSIDMGPWISQMETNQPATVMKTGLRIVATEPVTAYYEVANGLNGEIFSLKGRNANGNNFIISGQSAYDVSDDYFPLPYSSIDIVATKDNTRIKVIPTTKFVGHELDTEIYITLNQGETYSLRKVSMMAGQNFAGTIVESNKPIAITFKDDSVEKSTCRDIVGDQTFPIKVTGKEYIAVKGFLDAPEYVFITATADNTKITFSGSSAQPLILNKGQTHRLELLLPAVYISSNKGIYVFHVTGFGCELGGAVLPPVTCTGSKRVTFTRSTPDLFGLDILVRREGIFFFSLNGQPGLVPAGEFKPVPGTNNEWYSAQLSYSNAEVPTGFASALANDRYSFQVGVINGNRSSTARYGYFSAFATLFIGDDIKMCEGDMATIDAGPGKGSYKWSTGATTQAINVTEAGKYWVTITSEDCILTDTLNVFVKPKLFDIGPDVLICPDAKAKIDGQANSSWLWSDGSTGRYLEASTTGKYGLQVKDFEGCVSSDTIEVLNYVDRFNETVRLRIDQVSVDTTTQENVDVNWTKDNGAQPEDLKFKLFKRQSGSPTWEAMLETAAQHGPLAFNKNETEKHSYEWYGVLVNYCGDKKLETLVHETMLLTGVGDTVKGDVKLEWNDYVGWPHGVEQYEVWRKLDGGGFVKVGSTNTSSFVGNILFDGFTHRYVIRAFEADGDGESWSNIIQFRFEHPLFAYNVFTPNGDSFNEVFAIRNIHLYRNVHVTVMNRWGQRVFEDFDYRNTWDGGDSPAGVYYYVIHAGNGTSEATGVVSLVR